MSEGHRLCGNCFNEVMDGDATHCPKCGYTLGPGEILDALPVGSILNGHYIIGRALGQGGFGITYKALDHTTGDVVAVKEYFPDALCRRATETSSVTVSPTSRNLDDDFYYGREKFLREAETLAGLGDVEGIVHVHEYFEENGTAYFSMDYVEGTDLKDYLKQRGGRMRWQELRDIVYPIMGALDAVHKRGIIHRDISPDNIYVKDTGEAVLLDFGAARASLGERSQSLSVILKHGYAPKEQYYSRGKQGPFTDVYAMGATIYRSLTGVEPPESLERSEAISEGQADPLRPLHEYVPVDPGVESAVLRALSIDARDRFQTMGEFRDALRAADASGAAPLSVGGGVTAQPVETKPADGKAGATKAANVLGSMGSALTSVSEKMKGTSAPEGADAKAGAAADGEAKKKGPNLSRRQMLGIAGGVGAAAIVAIAATTCGRGGGDDTDTHSDTDTTQDDTTQDDTTSTDTSTPKQPSGLSLDKAYAVLYTDGELVFQESQDTEEGREVAHAAAVDLSDPWWIGKTDSISVIGGDGTEHEGDWCDQVKKVSSATPIALPDMTGYGVMSGWTTTEDFGLFNACVNLTDISGLSSWDVSSAKTLHHMFNLCTSLTDVSPLSSWDLSSVTDIKHLFSDCRALTDISPLSGWDTSSVQDLSALFQNCAALDDLTPIAKWDISSVRSMEVAFNDCVGLRDLTPLSGWDMSKVENVHGLFAVCPALTDLTPISGWDLSSAKSINGLFYDCEALSDLSPISGWDTSSVTDVSHMFSGCKNLRDLSPLSGWDLSHVTTMSSMFYYCDLLTDLSSLSSWNVSAVTDFSNMFYGTPIADVSALSSWDTSAASSLAYMFCDCKFLADISGLSDWNVSIVKNLTRMFLQCAALKDASPIDGWNVSPAADTTDMFEGCPATTPSWYNG